MALKKRTPCVGICSTTYGDLVCRGCKRFAHEIVQWNGYDPEQQEQIWARLNHLRDEVVAQRIQITDASRFEELVSQAQLNSVGVEEQIYELLRHMVVESQSLAKAGLACSSGEQTSLDTLKRIDAEIYARSKAHYERNFKVPV